MATAFAAILYRPTEVSDEALSRGVAVAAAGFDAPAPHLSIATLPSIPGWTAAFYGSGAKWLAHEELEHATELFEEELPPALAVRDAAAESGAEGAVLYALVFDDELVHDDAWRFDAEGFARRFARDGDDGLEIGAETAEASESELIELELDEDAPYDAERAAIELAIAEHRGSAFLSAELGGRVLPALMGALFAPERRIEARLCEPSPASIERETRRLNRALRRTDGRSAFEPVAVGSVTPPPPYVAFVRAYDWADPADPGDLYRELALGAVEGTLRFLRAADLAAKSADPAWTPVASRGLYPIARLSRGGLGGARGGDATLALAEDGATLLLVGADGGARAAGPTLGELLVYLGLGWKARSAVEEDRIGALMLRARLRADA